MHKANGRFKHPSLSTRLGLGLASLIILLTIVCLLLLLHQQNARYDLQLRQSRQQLISQLHQQVTLTADTLYRNLLQGIAVSALHMNQELYDAYLAGLLTEVEARTQARQLLARLSIGRIVSIQVMNSQGTILAHPKSEELGQNRADTSLNRWILASKQGYQCLATTKESSFCTASHTVYFAPWDWIITACASKERFLTLADRDQLLRLLAVGHESGLGEAFLLSSTGKAPIILSTPSRRQRLNQLALEIRRLGSGQIKYLETSPHGGVPMTVQAEFAKLDQLPIIVGLLTTLPAPGYRWSQDDWITLVSLLFCGLLAGVLTLFTCHLVLRPLRLLGQQVRGELPADLRSQVRPDQTEIQTISASIDQLLGALKTDRLDLAQTSRLLTKTRTRLKTEVSSNQESQDSLQAEISSRRKAVEKLHLEVASRKSAETYLQLFKNIFDNAIEAILITDAEARILAVNDSFCKLTGFSITESVGQNPRFLQSGQHTPQFFTAMWQSLTGAGHWSGEIVNRKKSGETYPQWLSISAIKDTEGQTTHYFAFGHDMTEIKKKEELISFMAYHDTLTRLPNRAALESRMSKALARAKRSGTMLAIFFLDLDNFKNINDSMGHDRGDELLVVVARRLSITVRDEDTLSRLGGDEFIILSEDVKQAHDISALATRLLESFREPFTLENRKLYVGASIGIAVYPSDGNTTQELIKNADIAMYRAKSEGRNKFMAYTEEMNERVQTHIHIESAIRIGLKEREFEVFYQPKIDLRTNRTSSFEALIRWRQGTKHIRPDQFIPVAEQSSLIDEMGLYVLEEACRFLIETEQQARLVPVSINISPRTFSNTDIVDSIDAILTRYGVNRQMIEFEITETTAMTDVEYTIKVMERFRKQGIQFSIDDFGTGYSSLSYLNVMPVSTLKIDKQFISANGVTTQGIVSTIVAIAQQMQLTVVAEGVETEAQAEWLRQIGCDEVQGYLYAKPLPKNEALDFLKEN